MAPNIGLVSYLTASLAYALLAFLLAMTWRDRPYRASLVIACGLTALWAAVISVGTLLEYPPISLMQLLEVARNAGWTYFLLQLTATRFDGVQSTIAGRHWKPLFAAVVLILLTLIFLSPKLQSYLSVSHPMDREVVLASWLGMAIIGLLLLEQIFRNANDGESWSLKYLCFGLGVIFAYDLLMYSEALLFRQLSPEFWQARGFANFLAAPLLAISFARSSSWNMALNISRQVVFHTVSLLGAGIYLITMAIVGYFIKFTGGNWGGVLQISFLIAAGALLLALFFSGKIRAKTRVLLSKHFFNYKYDYREEWLKITQALAEIGNNVPDGVVHTISSIVNSPAGLLWGRSDDGKFPLLSHWQMPAPRNNSEMAGLALWLEQSQWVIDIDELKTDPELYNNLNLPSWMINIPEVWLIVPMMFGDKLLGILLLKHSELQRSTAGRQAASHLAQHLSSEALVEARQFDAFNRLSAYVIHDLKNILAQQSLMIANAEKHKHKAAFVDDMIATVSNSVERMTKLMEQMRSGTRDSAPAYVKLDGLLQETLATRNSNNPKPTLTIKPGDFSVQSDRDRLTTVFGHLIQNAQEACSRDDQVSIKLCRDEDLVVVEVKDTGKGMDAEFVRSRLFKPFDSTKGLTGMGIGAFESREFIRSLGGDILVQSTLGKGSVFRVVIPYLQETKSD